jgi:hypothetical protein
MPVKIKDFEKNVIGKIKKNFRVEKSNKHHIYYEVYFENKMILKIYYSHGSGGNDISDNILSKIKKELFLDNSQQLRDLINCPMSSDDYFNLLKEKNILN